MGMNQVLIYLYIGLILYIQNAENGCSPLGFRKEKQ